MGRNADPSYSLMDSQRVATPEKATKRGFEGSKAYKITYKAECNGYSRTSCTRKRSCS